MGRTRTIAATLTAALLLGGLTTAVAAQDGDESMESMTGVIVAVVNADGGTDYFLELEDGTRVRLSVGPPWYWGESHPLAPYDGQTVVLGGLHTGGLPNENASDVARARASGDPAFEVRTINDVLVWGLGRPPWAGGPRVVGASHPGFEGWSWGRQMSGADDGVTADDELDAEGVVGGPAVAGEEHPGFEGWSKGRAAKATKGGKATKRANAAGRKGGPKTVGETHPGHAGWSKGQAARTAKASKAKSQAKEPDTAGQGRRR